MPAQLQIPLRLLRQPAFVYDADGRIASANDPAEALAGRSLAGLSPTVAIGLFDLRSPDGLPFLPEALPAARALAGEEVVDVPLALTASDGRSVHVLATAFPLRERGRVAGALSIWYDVTEQRQADQDRAFHALLLDQLDDAVIATDTALRVTAWNRAAEELYGWPAGEAIGRSAREVTGAVASGTERREPVAPLDRAEPLRHRVRLPRRDGRPLVVEERSAPIRDPTGTPIGYVAVNRDVTEQERLRAELAESEEKYRNLVELSPDAILIHRDGTIVFANPAALAMLGTDRPDDLVGRAVLEIVHPEAKRHVGWNIAADLRGEESPPATVEVLRMDGTTVTVQGRGARITFGGGPAVQVVLRDVTEAKRAEASLRRSEERLRDVLELSLDAVYRFDLVADRYDYISPVIEQVTGTPAEEFAALGMDEFIDRVHPDEGSTVAAVFADPACRSDTIEYRFRCRDGSYRWLADHFVVQVDAAGRSRFVTGVVRDVTKRREDQEALLRFADDLGRSNEELQRFAYVASHDLQEPLRSIVSFSQLLERRLADRNDGEIGEFLAFIIEGGVRMQALIQDLLQLSRIETKAQPPEPTDAGGVVAEVLASLETPIREAGATVEVGDLPVVTVDRSQLAQVFTNLIGNALKYRRPEVPLEVRVSAERAAPFWRFAVADNGIGIEAEYFDRIFVIFQRLHTKDRYEGTGIGLAVVKKIVERHGGAVGVESVPGEGSTFVFTLPDEASWSGAGRR